MSGSVSVDMLSGSSGASQQAYHCTYAHKRERICDIAVSDTAETEVQPAQGESGHKAEQDEGGPLNSGDTAGITPALFPERCRKKESTQQESRVC